MNKKINNYIHSKSFLILLIVLLILLVTTTGTYAWLTWSSTTNTDVTLKIGELASVTFTGGSSITSTSLVPVYNYTDGESTTFTINNRDTTGTKLKYTININITTIANELKGNILKYAIVEGTTLVAEGDFSKGANNTVLSVYEDNLKTGKTTFTFYLYLDANVETTTDIQNKSINANITVNVEEGEILAPVGLAKTITDLYLNSTKSEVTNNNVTYRYDPSNNLINDRDGGTNSYNGGNIRYFGSDPNNYLYFNCDTYPETNCELWRIIGVFDGKVKIMRSSTIGSYSWDNKNSNTGAESNYGKNDWSDARLMKLLNPGYDSEEVGGSLYYNAGSGNCYSGQNNATTTCNFTTTGLKNDETRGLISESMWYLRGSASFSDTAYEYERTKGSVYSGRPTSWKGKIAIPYPSDYGYAADFNQCTVNLYNYNNSLCTGNNWMFKNSYLWLLAPYSGYSNVAWYVYSSGDVYYDLDYTFNGGGVAPVLYLNSDLEMGSGTGKSDDPYRLSV